MLSRVHNFALRNRRKFIVTGVVIGGTILAVKYAKRKLHEIYDRQTKDCYAKILRQQHFKSTLCTCNEYIIGMSYDMLNVIIKECNTDELLEQLRSQPSHKLQIWQELKIVSFTRLASFVYASSILVVAARIQLNLLGGYLYRDKIATNQPAKISDRLKQEYLALNRYFIEKGGLSDLVRFIRNKVISVFGDLKLDKTLNLTDIERIFWSLQLLINGDSSLDPCSNVAKYMLPKQLPCNDQSEPDRVLHGMFNETLDFLESDDVCSVCSSNVWRGFSIAIDAMAEEMTPNAQTKQIKPKSNTITNNNDKQSLCNERLVEDNTRTEELLPTATASSPSSSETTMPATSTSISTTSTTTTIESSSLNESVEKSSSQSTVSNGYIFKINDVSLALAKIIPIVTKLTDECYDQTMQKQNFATNLISSFMLWDKCNVLGANVYEVFTSNSTS